ncbi:type I toxin-antitoxin system toxin SymE [Tahibacter aquaticus]|uniref:Type I toxin-antitoxin system toxin SymE n=1 Tax=Tahibacter aquaticus TaxID=520092 RepID=A0A4R6YIN8_9GAMM|nr:type I toxin-antitoxin system toxin SymE [Tahibacter aquaticus]
MAKAKHRSSTTDKRITVGASHYPTLRDRDQVGDRDVPYIRLHGHWLQWAGFPPNGRIRVRVLHGCLVMTCEAPPATKTRRR